MSSVGIKISVAKQEIISGIQNVMRSRINSAVHVAAGNIRRDLLQLIEGLFKGSPTYQSLISGQLKDELQVPDIDQRLEQILNTLKASLDVSVIPVASVAGSFRGGLNINLIRSGFQDILRLAAASYDRPGFAVPWLEWLLMQGDRVILMNYNFQVSTNQVSKGTPISSPAYAANAVGVAALDKGGTWRVPAGFAGDLSDNWITRAFNVGLVQKEIGNIFIKRISESLK